MAESKIRNIGTGPGSQTLDGCSVEFYRRLRPGNEVAIVLEACPPPATLLELGCGCGRLTRPFSESGYSVTAVDNSAEMLSCIDFTETLQSDIESLQTGKFYDVVLLASRVFNCPRQDTRQQLLQTARAHLETGAMFLLEVHGPSILKTRVGDSATNDEYSGRTLSSEIDGNHARFCFEYRIGDDVWTHSAETEYLPPEKIEQELNQNGFQLVDWLTNDQTWIKAVAV